MDIKTMEIKHIKNGNVGWIEEHFTFETGQKATFHTHTHKTKCFNGMGRDITETEIGKKMIVAIESYLDTKA
jgi:hypothetical protein